MTQKQLSAGAIIRELCRERFLRSLAIPNYTPSKWFENDLFEVTNAGYWHEYEVKISRGDFKADATKRKEGWAVKGGQWQREGQELKHDRLARGDETGPSRFTFVVPEGLIGDGELPCWAGLIVATVDKYSRVYLRTIRTAPRLHDQKVNEKIVAHAKGVCYYRMHRLIDPNGLPEHQFELGEGI